MDKIKTKTIERLKTLRSRKNLLQKDVADILGIHERQYRRYEAGTTHPPMRKLVELCNFYEVTIDYILGLSDDDTPKLEKLIY